MPSFCCEPLFVIWMISFRLDSRDSRAKRAQEVLAILIESFSTSSWVETFNLKVKKLLRFLFARIIEIWKEFCLPISYWKHQREIIFDDPAVSKAKFAWFKSQTEIEMTMESLELQHEKRDVSRDRFAAHSRHDPLIGNLQPLRALFHAWQNREDSRSSDFKSRFSLSRSRHSWFFRKQQKAQGESLNRTNQRMEISFRLWLMAKNIFHEHYSTSVRCLNRKLDSFVKFLFSNPFTQLTVYFSKLLPHLTTWPIANQVPLSSRSNPQRALPSFLYKLKVFLPFFNLETKQGKTN